MKLLELDVKGNPKLLTAYKYPVRSTKDIRGNEVLKTMKAYIDKPPKLGEKFYIWLCATETNAGGEVYFEVNETNEIILSDGAPAIATQIFSNELSAAFNLVIQDRQLN